MNASQPASCAGKTAANGITGGSSSRGSASEADFLSLLFDAFDAASAGIKSLTAEVAEDPQRSLGKARTGTMSYWRLLCRLYASGLSFQPIDGFPRVSGLRAMRKDLQIAFEFRDRFVGAIHFLEADG